jgi:hypothetical protein
MSNPSFYNVELNRSLVSTFDKVDRYLYGHPQLLSKRSIFFVVNESHEHWYGFAAINSWKAIVNALVTLEVKGLHTDYTKKRKTEIQAGILFNDSLLSIVTKPSEVEKVFPFLWLLNMMSHYRDLNLNGRRHEINFVEKFKEDSHSGLHMFLMGVHGPFGNILTDTFESLPFQFINRSVKSISFQGNGFDCGICWCLFIYDTVLALHNRPLLIPILGTGKVDVKKLLVMDATYHFGHYIHSSAFLANPKSVPLCFLWCMEMLLLIERLRWCYLSSKHCDITRPNNWGKPVEKHLLLLDSPDFKANIIPILKCRNQGSRTKVNALWKKEREMCVGTFFV